MRHKKASFELNNFLIVIAAVLVLVIAAALLFQSQKAPSFPLYGPGGSEEIRDQTGLSDSQNRLESELGEINSAIDDLEENLE